MNIYEEKLKESLVTLHFGVLEEYKKNCTENGVAESVVLLANGVVDFINLCNQARNYYDNTRKTLSAYKAGAYAVSGDQTTDDYLEKAKIRYEILLNKIRSSDLTDSEQSELLANLILNVGDFSNNSLGFIPKSESFIKEMVSALDDEYLVSLYNQLKSKYAYSGNIKAVLDERGLEVESGGCYVATCVYGSYDCPEVWTLRRFRDNILSKNLFGRMFIKCYYAVSPTAVKLFGDYLWFHKLFKAPLDKLVIKLQDQGVENTPYNDK